MENKENSKKIVGVVVFLVVLAFLAYFAFGLIPVPEEIAERETDPGVVVEPEETVETVPEPMDDFEEAVEQLNSPQKLISYLNEGFVLEENGANDGDFYTPQKFFAQKSGHQKDWAVFASYVLGFHKHEVAILRYEYVEPDRNQLEQNTVVIFRGHDRPKTIFFSEEGAEMYAHGWSFNDALQKEAERTGFEIKRYTIASWLDSGEFRESEEWFEN